MSRYVPPMAAPPLGKLYLDNHDVCSLKCLVAVRMTVRHVDVDVVSKGKKGRNSGNPLLFTAAGGNVQLRDPFAISWFLANYDNRSPERGGPDRHGAQIVQWNSFSVSEVVPHLTWLLRGGGGSSKANELRKRSLSSSLDALNSTLKGKRFLVGDKFTLADVCVAADLVPVLDPDWAHHLDNPMVKGALEKHHVYLCEWYSAVASRPMFKAALGELRWPPAKTAVPVAGGMGGGDNVGHEQPHKKPARAWKRKKPPPAAGHAKASPVLPPVLPPEIAVFVGKPLRVLCLHGYRQNGELFRRKIGSFRKFFGDCVDFTFVTAPHRVVPISAKDANQDQRGWWFSREDGYFKSDDVSDCDQGLDASLDLIQKTFETNEPFDGVLGFSQGAALATLICLMAERRPESFSPSLKFKFVMLFASFRSACSKHSTWYDQSSDAFKPVSVPSLHVIGSGDKVIASTASEQLLGLFQNPTVLHHPGGHFVPSSKDQKLPYFQFLSNVNSNDDKKDVNQNASDSDPKKDSVDGAAEAASEVAPPTAAPAAGGVALAAV